LFENDAFQKVHAYFETDDEQIVGGTYRLRDDLYMGRHHNEPRVSYDQSELSETYATLSYDQTVGSPVLEADQHHTLHRNHPGNGTQTVFDNNIVFDAEQCYEALDHADSDVPAFTSATNGYHHIDIVAPRLELHRQMMQATRHNYTATN
jgi:hypothetical protein